MCISEESVPGDVYNPTHETQLIPFSDQCLSECCDESLSNPYQPKINFLKSKRTINAQKVSTAVSIALAFLQRQRCDFAFESNSTVMNSRS